MPSQDTGDLQLRTTSHKVQEELEHWERLVFSFEMDRDNESSNTRGKNQTQQQGSRSTSSSNQPPDAGGSGLHDATLLAQIAAASEAGAGFDNSFAQLLNTNPYSQAPFPPGFYNNPFPHTPMGHTQLPPISSLDFAWNQLAHQQGVNTMYNLPLPGQFAPPIIPYPNAPQGTQVPPPIPPLQIDTTRSRGRGESSASGSSSQPSQSRAGSASATSPTASANLPVGGDDPTEIEQLAITEEKRRRNTAASARFRIKKKQRTINLERTVSDLTGRAEELEKEAVDLRRENGWLKEIVMLKGSRYAAAASAQQRMALSQAVKDAGIDLMVEGTGQASTSGASGSGSGVAEEPLDISSDEDSDDDYTVTDKKGKAGTSLGELDQKLFSMSFGRPPSINIGFTPSPPDRGSFPLDHYGECKEKMTLYMKCLKENSSNSTPCRALSRDYLDCRMQKGLMERDDWSNLGLQNVDGKKNGTPGDTSKKS